MAEQLILVPLEAPFITKGLVVHQSKFGKGKVLDCIGSSGREEIIIKFDDVGVKRLILKFSNLKVALSEEVHVEEPTGTPDERRRMARKELASCASALFHHAQGDIGGTKEFVQSLLRRLAPHAQTLQEQYPDFTVTNLLYAEARRLHEERPHLKLTHERRDPGPLDGPESNTSLVGGRGGRGAVIADKEYHGE